MGAAERGLLRQGLRYSLVARLSVVGVASLVSLFLESSPVPALTAVVVLGLNAWNGWYAYERLRADGSCPRWLVPVDVLVVCAVCLTQAWTVAQDPAAAENAALSNWVVVAAEITVVAYPWQTSTVGLIGVTLSVATAYVGGTAITQPDEWLSGVPLQLWLVVEAVLSWSLYRLVRRRAQSSDEQVARGERLRLESVVANARRVDENEYLATLHDTASATLLMVGAGVVSERKEWLADQAARDLDAIRGPAVVAGGEVDLIEMLREVLRRTPLRVRRKGIDSLRVPAVDAVMLCHGTREALTNVLRHADTDDAETVVSTDGVEVVVEVSDRGRGFDPGKVSDHRHGVTRSLVARMTRIGGSATVTSEPGVGTTVRMSCPLTPNSPAADDTEIIARNFVRGLRWGVVVMGLVILFLLDLPKLLANLDAYDSLAGQVVAMGGFLAVTAVVAGFTWRGRSLGWWRWPLLAVVFCLSVLATQTISADERLGVAHWSEGDAGWWAVLLLLDSRLAVFVCVLAMQYVLTFTQAGIAGHTEVTVAGVMTATLIVFSYQVAVGMIAAVLRGLAAPVARVAREEEQLRTTEAVQRYLHEDRRERLAGLADTTVPLLDGLASGRLDPADETVRRACAVEATRMRRLFVEAAAESDPLLHELRACIDLAERNGVSVSFAEYGNRPAVPLLARRTLTEPAVAVLATARGKVRLTMAGTDETVTVSVVAARTPYTVPRPDRDGVRTAVVEDGDRLWIQTTWRGET